MTDNEKELMPCPFDNFINKKQDCWLWTGAIQSNGYGNHRLGLAHRIVYEFYNGEIPKELTIDHICKVRNCVNPSHLRLMTQYENSMLGDNPTAINKRKTECIHGHPLTGENLKIRIRDGQKRRICGSRAGQRQMVKAYD